MQTYIVGGAVRDELLGRPNADRDYVVVGATPEAMLAQGFRPVGKDFPVFLHPDTHEEYALARTERKTGRGYHGFAFHAAPDVTLDDDLARRDLTINAMAKAADGRLIDPFHGQRDLQAKVLRHVGPAFAETLFDISIRPDNAPVWNSSVQFYRIERASDRGTELIGQYYLDPTARNGKRGGAWMDDVRTRWMRPDTGQLQTPVAHLVCNFADGMEANGVHTPALLSHDDVITLFHEFGHGLHHMLTQVNERDVSGISGVEWDAVELPSQFMENFCWEWNVLKNMTAHVETGKPLPRALFDKMLAAKNFQSGMQTLRQIEFSLFDMLLHTAHDPQQDFMPLLNQVRQEVAVLQPPSWSRTAHTFGHIFAGGYAAGYYSYKWAEVLSADAYAAFEETADAQGLPNPQTGRKYRQAILEAGGSRPAMESFKAFRGREPTLEALLRHQGMSA